MDNNTRRRSRRARVPTKRANDVELVLSGSATPVQSHQDSDSDEGDEAYREAASEENEASSKADDSDVPSELDAAQESGSADESIESPRRTVAQKSNVLKRKLATPRDTQAREVEDSQHPGFVLFHGRKANLVTEHNRGLDITLKSGNSANRTILYIGTDPKDVARFTDNVRRWDVNVTLPSRWVDANGRGGLGPMLMDEDSAEKDRADGADTAISDVRRHVDVNTIYRQLPTEEGLAYLGSAHEEHEIQIGSFGNLHSLRLPRMTPWSLNNVHLLHLEQHGKSTAADDDEPSRRGWLINLGNAVHCMDWAYNEAGNEQYLALATREIPTINRRHSAMTASESSPSNIQIWSFFGGDNRAGWRLLCHQRPPQLVQVICTDWGTIRQLKWHPRVGAAANGSNEISLGLLAVISSDGCLRIVEVKVPVVKQDSNPNFVRCDQAFSLRPAGTICTCVTWVMPNQIAAGCANGKVVMWDLPSVVKQQRQQNTTINSPQNHKDSFNDQSNAKNHSIGPPSFFCHLLHQTYILAITTTWPLPSNLLATTCADGTSRLTDMRYPYMDYVESQRGAISNSSVTFSPHLQALLGPEDAETMRALYLRRFTNAFNICKTDGQITSVAAGHAHPSLLVGAASGNVYATNPVGRVFAQRGAARWRQTWFRHEWIPHLDNGPPDTVQSDALPPSTDSGEPAPLPRKGISRMTDGYAIDALALYRGKAGPESRAPRGKGTSRLRTTAAEDKNAKARGKNSNAKDQSKSRSKSTGSQTTKVEAGAAGADIRQTLTLFEEEAAITCLAWCPDSACGGWAAAGMGSGLLRVEDITVRYGGAHGR